MQCSQTLKCSHVYIRIKCEWVIVCYFKYVAILIILCWILYINFNSLAFLFWIIIYSFQDWQKVFWCVWHFIIYKHAFYFNILGTSLYDFILEFSPWIKTFMSSSPYFSFLEFWKLYLEMTKREILRRRKSLASERVFLKEPLEPELWYWAKHSMA